MSDEEKVQVIQLLHSQVMAAVLDSTELEFHASLEKFWERIAKDHYVRGYNKALRDLGAVSSNGA